MKDRMSLIDVFEHADRVLRSHRGRPALDDVIDPRWQAIIRVGECIDTHSEAVWQFVLRWIPEADDDLKDALATCLLEHLLDDKTDEFLDRCEALAVMDPGFASVLRRCWCIGQTSGPGNQERLKAIIAYARTTPRRPD